MFTRDAQMNVGENDIQFCFGMSKMAVTSE